MSRTNDAPSTIFSHGQTYVPIEELSELETQLAEAAQAAALNVEALDAELDRAVAAEAQRDQLADCLKELVKSTRKAIGPKSVRHAIRQPMWGKLWENIHAADELLAELEANDGE